MRINTITTCLLFLSYNCFSQVVSKDENLNSKQIADVIAKSIYIYSQANKDTSENKKNNAIIDLKDNISILDTLVFSQIQDYLKFNKAILNSLDTSDVNKFDSISTFHNQLYIELQNLLTFQKKNKITKESVLDIKFLNTNLEEYNRSLYNILINTSNFSIDVIINITDTKNKEVVRLQKTLTPNEYLELNSLKDYFTSDSLNIYFIAKFTSDLGKSYYYSKIIENHNAGTNSLKLIYVFSPTEKNEDLHITTKEVETLFEKKGRK